jgi:hypothetical protein
MDLEWIKEVDVIVPHDQLVAGETYEYIPDHNKWTECKIGELPKWMEYYHGNTLTVLKNNLPYSYDIVLNEGWNITPIHGKEDGQMINVSTNVNWLRFGKYKLI